MSLVLEKQLNTFVNTGFKKIKNNQESIIKEWKKIHTQFRVVGEKSEKKMEETIGFFSELLFSYEKIDLTEFDSVKQKLRQTDFLQTNQFIINLFENTVHKVLQNQSDYTYHDYQAVQFIFSRLADELLTQQNKSNLSMDAFIQYIVSSYQLPIEWVATVKSNDHKFAIDKWFKNPNSHFPVKGNPLEANTIFSLTEKLLNQMSEDLRRKNNVLPLPYDDDLTLLVCVDHYNADKLLPFITYILELFQEDKRALKLTKQESHWKDSVIMFNESIIRSRNLSEAVESITAGFINYLPFERCALFSYSVHDQMIFGLLGHHMDNQAIKNITEDISNFPLVKENSDLLRLFGNRFNYLQPVYVEEASVGLPKKYVDYFNLGSIVVVPIYLSSERELTGIAILDQGANQYFKLDRETFSALNKFGQSAGQVLKKYSEDEQNVFRKKNGFQLAPREIDVLQLMAQGESTTQAADKLNLSEYTVRDYVSSLMVKMNARNRTEAVARAIRKGVI